MTKKVNHLNILRTKITFKDKIKSIFHHFLRAFIEANKTIFLEGKSLTSNYRIGYRFKMVKQVVKWQTLQTGSLLRVSKLQTTKKVKCSKNCQQNFHMILAILMQFQNKNTITEPLNVISLLLSCHKKTKLPCSLNLKNLIIT